MDLQDHCLCETPQVSTNLLSLFHGQLDLQTQSDLRETIGTLVREALSEDEDRRKEPRFPFFRPVTVLMDEGKTEFSAFCRDISNSGIGLLHARRVIPGRALISVPTRDKASKTIPVDILYSRSCGGYYLSGGTFVLGEGSQE